MASMAMVAIEATIVSTAMPQIVAQLGDLHLYSWVFSSFLLAQTAMTVVFRSGADGITGVEIALEPAVAPILFTRQPPKLAAEKEILGDRERGPQARRIPAAGVNDNVPELPPHLQHLSPDHGTGEGDGGVARAPQLFRAEGGEIRGRGLLVRINQEHVPSSS